MVSAFVCKNSCKRSKPYDRLRTKFSQEDSKRSEVLTKPVITTTAFDFRFSFGGENLSRSWCRETATPIAIVDSRWEF